MTTKLEALQAALAAVQASYKCPDFDCYRCNPLSAPCREASKTRNALHDMLTDSTIAALVEAAERLQRLCAGADNYEAYDDGATYTVDAVDIYDARATLTKLEAEEA